MRTRSLRIRRVRSQRAIIQITEKCDPLIIAPKDVPYGHQRIGIDVFFENIIGKFSTYFGGCIETSGPVRYNETPVYL